MGGKEASFCCAALRCTISAGRCAARWHASNVERRPRLTDNVCIGCPLGAALSGGLLDVVPRTRKLAPRTRSKGVGRGKSVPWDDLPSLHPSIPRKLKLGAMSDEDLARLLSPYVDGGITSAAIRSARYTRGIARFTPPRFPEHPLLSAESADTACAS